MLDASCSMESVLGNHCSSIIKQHVGPAVGEWNGEKTWGLLREGLAPSSARTFFLRLLFHIKISPNRILRNCRASAFIPFTQEEQGLSTQLRMWQKEVIPARALGLAPCSPAELREPPAGHCVAVSWTLRAPCITPSPGCWGWWRISPQPGAPLQWESPRSFSQPHSAREIWAEQGRALTWLEIWGANRPGWN